jgi:hypothetical protein
MIAVLVRLHAHEPMNQEMAKIVIAGQLIAYGI